ncbi:MAG: hypothetical protein AAFN59_10045 [Pseudomonadota bacterium]
MATDYEDFDARMRRIERRNRALSKGYVMSIDRDGLIVARPARRTSSMIWGLLLKIAIIVMAFKVAAYSIIGATDYTFRVEALAQGTTAEQIAAWIMTADPITVWLSQEAIKLIAMLG